MMNFFDDQLFSNRLTCFRFVYDFPVALYNPGARVFNRRPDKQIIHGQ